MGDGCVGETRGAESKTRPNRKLKQSKLTLKILDFLQWMNQNALFIDF